MTRRISIVNTSSSTKKKGGPPGEKTQEQTERISLHRNSLDLYLDMLANTYRRRLLVASLERDQQGDSQSLMPGEIAGYDEDVDCLTIEMIHRRLPKLDSANIVEWDQETERVEKVFASRTFVRSYRC